MTRILFSLASFSIILLATALILGLTIDDLYAPDLSDEALSWATLHRLTGIAAALAVVFVESIIVTYFIGTSRWCKEVVETYKLDRELVRQSAHLKRRTFPWALVGMLAVVVIIALGGAADPASGGANTSQWAPWHLTGALIGIVLIGWTYFVSWNHIHAHHRIIEQIIAQVGRIRRQRGLDMALEDAPAEKAGPARQLVR